MVASRDRGPNGRTPLHVLTGFLGSGKTTVLARLLERPGRERLAILVNEVGALSLDHHLLEELDEGVLALPSGCVCCTLRGELHEALERVLAHAPTRVVLETTGLADPAPILHALSSDPSLRSLLTLGGVVAAVDASRAEELLAAWPEARRQLDLCDRVLLTRADLAPARLPGARALVAAAAPGREVRVARHGRVARSWLLGSGPLEHLVDASGAREWLHHHPPPSAPRSAAPPAGGFRTHAASSDAPADVGALQLWLRLVTQLDGERLLRVKVLAECARSGHVFCLQAAGHAVSPPRRLRRRPPGVVGAHMVAVEHGLPARVVERLVASFAEAAQGVPSGN